MPANAHSARLRKRGTDSPAAVRAARYSPPVRLRIFSATHQSALLVNPPKSTTTSLGSPVHSAGVPAAALRSANGPAASSPKAMHELSTPQNSATPSPFLKLNSFTAARFASAGNSRSLLKPASAESAMPTTHTASPANVICPAALAAIVPIAPLKIGGISVPQTAEIPSATP